MTLDYFNHQYNQALDTLSNLRQHINEGKKWGIKTTDNHYERCAALFLYIGAITNYDPTAIFNFLTEGQVYFILEQIRTLIILPDNGTI